MISSYSHRQYVHSLLAERLFVRHKGLTGTIPTTLYSLTNLCTLAVISLVYEAAKLTFLLVLNPRRRVEPVAMQPLVHTEREHCKLTAAA